VHGLAALMELQASRLHARVASDSSPILLTDQNRARWDRVLIGRGLAALARAEQLRTPLGPYALQAAIAACHARARTAGDTDWEQSAALYVALAQINPSPIVELNRAVAISMAYGPAEALVIVDRLVADGRLESYHLLPAVRADLLAKLGRRSEAHAELVRAAGLTRNEQERSLLRTRAAALEAELPGGFVAN
jgi:predicted RNA polymerase sigma factor